MNIEELEELKQGIEGMIAKTGQIEDTIDKGELLSIVGDIDTELQDMHMKLHNNIKTMKG